MRNAPQHHTFHGNNGAKPQPQPHAKVTGSQNPSLRGKGPQQHHVAAEKQVFPRPQQQKSGASSYDASKWIVTSQEDMRRRGWEQLDVLLISGDAYIDHPSFGIPLLARWLERHHFKTGIIAQPRWDTPEDIKRLGRPRLFCGISAGAIDSMLAHYTTFRKKRHDDAYTPGGQAGARPNRATIVYTNLVRAAFPGIFVALGGIEASLRKLAHYDFWTDSLRRSLLFDSKADIILYGMGELSILELATRLQNGQSPYGIPGSAHVGNEAPEGAVVLPSYEEIQQEHRLLIKATQMAEQHFHDSQGRVMAQGHGNKFLLVEPPSRPLTQEEMDDVYSLPYMRDQHPSYTEKVPALDMIRWSITAVRGCGGACSFCSLAQHQGRRMTSRSEESILKEINTLAQSPSWRGVISDVGGPTANFWGASCKIDGQGCKRDSCMVPSICPNLHLEQGKFLRMLRTIKRLASVKTVGIASGIRYDAALQDKEFMEGLVGEFVSGHLKIAPEHCQDSVLKLMRKPPFKLFEDFLSAFQRISDRVGKKQFVVPYIISAFPGCTEKDMRVCADWFKKKHWQPQQVQCFIPTPGTLATAMFFAGEDKNGNPLPVATSDSERLMQHNLLFK